MPRPQLPCDPKPCAHCGKMMYRKRFANTLEDRGAFQRRKFCDLKCMGMAKVVSAPTLGTIRGRTQKAVPLGSRCEFCGGDRLLGRHHMDQNPENNATENVKTLCATCHAKWHWKNGKKAKASPPCSVCAKPSRRRGLCQKHWFRFKRHGDPNLTMKSAGRGRARLVRVSPND